MGVINPGFSFWKVGNYALYIKSCYYNYYFCSAVANVGLGLALFDKTMSSQEDLRVFWLFVMFISVFILMNIGLILFAVVTRYNGTCSKS